MEVMDLAEQRPPVEQPGYMERSSAPLTCLIFSLPLFLVYHAGLWYLSSFADLHWANAIDIAIADGLGRLGMAGPLLSFILVVVSFLVLHAMSGKAWHWPPFTTWFLMVVESLILALPVFMLSRLVAKIIDFLPPDIIPLSAVLDLTTDLSWQINLVLSCGAGVYEEFFFRLLFMGTMSFVLGRIFGFPKGWKYLIVVTIQALVFAASHHLPGGPEEIVNAEQAREMLPVFIFRTLAGVYFAILYIERGFGIAAGSHAGYDLMVVMLDEFMPMG